MSGAGLPTNVDTTYDGNPADLSFDLHQQHHDLIHKVVNPFDKDAVPAVGMVWVFNGTLWVPRLLLSTDIPGIVWETVTGTTYTMVAADAGKGKHFTSASAITVTWPAGLSTVSGAVFYFRTYAAGQVSNVASGVATVNARGGTLKSAGQYANWQADRIFGTDDYILSGDLVV